MSIYISSVLLLVAVLLCLRFRTNSSLRTYFTLGVLLWAAFLLTFYMDGLVRAAALLRGNPLSTDVFNAGILAYREALYEIRISLGLLLGSLSILVFFPSYPKEVVRRTANSS